MGMGMMNQNNGNNQQWNSGNNHNNNHNQMSNMNNGNNHNGVTGLKGSVLSIIAHPQWEQSETGCNVETVFTSLSNEDVNEIRAAIDELSMEGHIYSTIDDDHYKCSSQ